MAVNLTVNTDTEAKTPAYAWYALGLLATANLLNYLDRSLIYILFTPIKKEMAFTDFQLGLLGMTSFVIFLLSSVFLSVDSPIVAPEKT